VPISRIYDLASSMLAQEVSQIDGVGQVTSGAVRSRRARRAESERVEQVRHLARAGSHVLSQANADRPKGQLADERTSWEIDSSDQLYKAVNYLPLIVAARQGAVVRLLIWDGH
jgi:multidrug efflux pump